MREGDRHAGRARGPGHERRDISVRAVGLFFVGLLVVAFLVHVAMWGAFRYFAARAERADPARPALGAVPTPPPEPRLQTTPARDLQAVRAAEDAVLTSYGWVDRQAGLVRIPIDRAMALLVERARSSQPPAASVSGSATPRPGEPHAAPPPAPPGAGTVPDPPHEARKPEEPR